jgi:hypothetical protein
MMSRWKNKFVILMMMPTKRMNRVPWYPLCRVIYESLHYVYLRAIALGPISETKK